MRILMSANWGKPATRVSFQVLPTHLSPRQTQSMLLSPAGAAFGATAKEKPSWISSSRGQSCAISCRVFGETGVQALAAPGSEQGTRGQGGASSLLTVSWALPSRSSSFGSELHLRVAMEIWGPRAGEVKDVCSPFARQEPGDSDSA